LVSKLVCLDLKVLVVWKLLLYLCYGFFDVKPEFTDLSKPVSTRMEIKQD